MGIVNASVFVVTAHNAPRVSTFDSQFKWTEIYLIEGTIGHFHIHMTAVFLLVIKCIMLDAACHSIALKSLNIAYSHASGEVRVFAHILEVASIERSTIDIDARTEQYILVSIACFLAYRLSIDGGKVSIPCGGKACQCRESGAGVIGPVGMFPVIPVYLHAHAVRSVAHREFWYAQSRASWAGKLALRIRHTTLLLECHP